MLIIFTTQYIVYHILLFLLNIKYICTITHTEISQIIS